MPRRRRHGWLETLRRSSGVVLALFAVVFAVGVARAHARALVAADETCAFMGGGADARRVVPAPAEPSDIADHAHDCCDLGLCHDGGAPLPPPAPPAAAAPRLVRRRLVRRSPRAAPRRERRSGFRSRAPPAL